jgi:hypothetical protein
MAGTRAKPELRTVTIAIVGEGAEAERMQSKLRSAGIESFLTSEASYAAKNSPNAAGAQRRRLIPPLANAAPATRQTGAVKVQVARADVERALNVLGATNLSASPLSKIKSPDTHQWKLNPRLLNARDPTVPIIVVVFVLVAALILSLS